MLELLKGKEIKCATVTRDRWLDEHERRAIVLKVGYTADDYERFLKELDFRYYSGYGVQELFGTVWFKDNTWAGRGEYDGSEWWEEHSLPDIPKELLPQLVVTASIRNVSDFEAITCQVALSQICVLTQN